ncbi:MAG: toll/interleukin-1 receptor domain-containing protein [Deltaproteobacteria bacterium]|nr:toll/interleukin-1 receptor domain-containing protein [Deltaproteobacteria bacterium]
MYDVFICHASEDKNEIARPLAESLRNAGLEVWYDEFTLKLGDSLRQSIEKGIASSKYGVVILSNAFFAKKWPQEELNGLYSKHIDGDKTIIPVWHHVDHKDVVSEMPILADKIAVKSIEGMDLVVQKVMDVVRSVTRDMDMLEDKLNISSSKTIARIPSPEESARKILQEIYIDHFNRRPNETLLDSNILHTWRGRNDDLNEGLNYAVAHCWIIRNEKVGSWILTQNGFAVTTARIPTPEESARKIIKKLFINHFDRRPDETLLDSNIFHAWSKTKGRNDDLNGGLNYAVEHGWLIRNEKVGSWLLTQKGFEDA